MASIKNLPLVSINIPTLNSEKTLERTLLSIKNQSYKNYEIIIIDSGSTDKTLEIARKFTKKIFIDKRKLLGARETGVNKSKGSLILLLDSDQILEKTAIERAVNLLKEKDYDMLVIEEDSYEPKNIIEKMSSADRRATHKKKILDPELSVLLPRFFKKEILINAFKKIRAQDPSLFNFVTLHDHAITYYECYKISKKIGYLEKAVFHKEPSSIKELFNHYYLWAVRSSSKSYNLPEEYRKMFARKLNNRYKSIDFFSKEFFLALPVIAIKGAGYYCGLLKSKFK